MAYSFSERKIQRYDWQVQATIFRDIAANEAHNALVWKTRYETLAAKTGMNA